MKGEVLSAKFETLKNQVNPHFLFNSLNVLTSLVYKDPDLSAKFIKELSNVYRHVIEVKDLEVVSLKQEIEFLLSFTFLLKMRHSEGLNVNINLKKVDEYNVVPLALQMLVENAVKHNIVSGEEPLSIDIYLENQYIVVHNNLQKKTVRETTSSNVGLINIKARYENLTDIPVITEESDTDFIVKLPVLSISK
jgi:LytS/YehU family sensor histidine kinase